MQRQRKEQQNAFLRMCVSVCVCLHIIHYLMETENKTEKGKQKVSIGEFYKDWGLLHKEICVKKFMGVS